MSQPLERLLQRCAVKVTVPGQMGWGTGFFVAPGQILTCFHVIKNAQNGQVNVSWQNEENWTEAVIEEGHELLDIALLKLRDVVDSIPCVHLDDGFQAEDRFYIYGYPDDFPGGASVTGQCEGTAQDQQTLIKFKAGQIRPGLSGSPILNQRTGKVCGMVKCTRDRSFDLGGGAVPVEAILTTFPHLLEEQRRFHQNNHQWLSLLPQSPSHAQLTRQDYRNRQALINKVNHYWIEGVLETSLDHHQAIALSLEERPLALNSLSNLREEFLDSPNITLSSDINVIDIFDQLGAGRTLLILGEPGAGKTITLLQLGKELIRRAREDAQQLIPVVLNLSSWAEHKQTIDQWIVKKLCINYQVPQKIAEGWVKNEQLLFLLDGLDEILTKESQEACIRAINQFHQDFGSPEMVVCCREKDYFALSERLNLESAIYLRSLTLEQIDHYLSSLGNEMSSLRTTIKRDPVLQELATSPLMLNILAIAYQGMNINEVFTSDSIEEQQQHIFNVYIQRMFKRRRQNPGNYSQRETIKKLAWLAQKMSKFSQSIFLIETMQPTWLDNLREKRLYRIGIRFLVLASWSTIHISLLGLYHSLVGDIPYNPTPMEILSYGVVAGLIGSVTYSVIGGLTADVFKKFASLFNGLILGMIYGLLYGIVWQRGEMGIAYGLMIGLVGILIYRPMSSEISPIETFKWSWEKATLYSGLGIIIALSLFLAGSTGGLLQSMILGVMVCFIFVFVKGEEIEQKTIVNQGIWKSATNAAKIFLTIGLLTTILFTLVEGWISGIINGILLGILGALLGAQFSGIVCIEHLVLRLILWRKGKITWNYARFLNYATARIFLQKVGGGYIFIHRRLREHFTQLS
ncbi:MAG: trypsin-like peptidase domain-containing protein [Crocosphaera sp.]|nr:trypsin-like peptidase domain-containing protein [Crocosphaera sp.]